MRTHLHCFFHAPRFAALLLTALPLWGSAQMAQQPLLTRSSAVEPNLVFMFDDSSSMQQEFMYQYGGSAGTSGMTGPGDSFSEKSPDVNRMYYDPKKRYLPRINADGSYQTYTLLSSSFNVYFYKNGSNVNVTWTGTPTSLASGNFFNPYTPPASALASGASTTTSYPRTAQSSTTSYPKWVGRTDCTGTTVCTWNEERTNYSIWYAFHRTRDALAKTGIGHAFQKVGATIRIGWGRINTLDDGTLDSGVALFDGTTKSRFYTWLYGINSNIGSTPNRLALDTVGKYYSRYDSDGPWSTDKSGDSKTATYYTNSKRIASTNQSSTDTEDPTKHYSCRRSFSMLMTDGYYNDSAPSVGGNVDGTNGPIITSPKGDSYQYKKAGTINTNDSSSNSFADTAMKYWVNDLRPASSTQGIANNVPSSTSNESFWQNMSFYAIGLGIFGTLPQTQTTIDNLKSGSTNWPTPTTNDPKAIDDMWHATLNARGALLTATDSDTLNTSVDNMMSSINKLTSSQSGVAVSTASLKTDTRKYTPEYTTGSWKGNVIARALDPNTGVEVQTEWQVQEKDSLNNVYDGIPTPASRNIVVGTAATSGTKAVAFNLTAMTTANLIGDMDSASRTTDMINYLRGDKTNEGDSGTASYRARENDLGDIVNSAPVFIKGMPGRELVEPYNLASQLVMEIQTATNPLPGTGTSYTTYKSTMSGRGEGVVLVGANDGMLHAFRDGSVASPTTTEGQEVFAYVPRVVLPNLHKLGSKTYSHLYFVDGPNIETDVYMGGTWKQLVVGTTGAGGKSVYALNVTSPLTLAASDVLWEINPTITGFTNTGFVLSDVQTGPLPNNQWAALFGNGYESTSGQASLFIVNLETGALIRELQTPLATGGPWSATLSSVTTSYKNGLGGVRLVRDANEQRIIGAYAGDLRGNLWRFDLSDINPSNWSVSLLFSTGAVTPTTAAPTGYSQPITASPQIVTHPSGGRLVVAGTGKFFEDRDTPAPYSTQTLYGIWDNVAFGSTFPTAAYPVTTSTLVSRTLSYIPSTTTLQITNPDGTVPGYITWGTYMGWAMNLPFDGQRQIYPIEKLDNRNSRVLSFGTMSPANVSLDACVQSGTGTGWDFFVDGLYGGDPGRAPDVPQSAWASVLGGNSGYVVGVQGKADGRNTTVRIDSQSTDTQKSFATLSGGSSGSLVSNFNCIVLGNCKPPPTNPTITPKTIKSREWRQLFLR